MKFEQIKKKDIEPMPLKSIVGRKMLEDFVNANIHFAEILYWEENYKNIESARVTLTRSAKVMHLNHIRLCVRKNRLFIENTLVEENEAE